MHSNILKNFLIVIMLGLLTASAFFIRVENFKNSRLRSIDEVVYYRMAKQILKEGISGYNTIPYGQYLASKGRPLPEYFFRPLFKHPPLFTLLASLSMKISGVQLLSAGYVSLFFGVLLIPLIYLLATMMFNRTVGILSALFMWLDPVTIICSQKVWMETTLTFFMILTIYLFLRGFKGSGDIYFVLGGIASGLAVLTKYPGILSLCIVLLYAAVHDRDIYKNKYFILGILMPVLFLSVWLYWNYLVYGGSFFLEQVQTHNIFKEPKRVLFLGLLAIILILGIVFSVTRKRKSVNVEEGENLLVQGIDLKRILVICIGILFVFLIRKQLIHAFQIDYFPITTWRQGLFAREPATFYFGRLIEFSGLFIFSFAAFFIYTSKNIDKKMIFILSIAVIFIFFMAWRNYQSRYILPAIPFLIILGVQLLGEMYEMISGQSRRLVRFSGKLVLALMVSYIIMKVYYLNAVVSFSNDMCYF